MEPSSLAVEGLEENYDLVVLGTNLSPSIVAAAAAFSHHSVLHLDANDFYGHLDDATFSFDQCVDWANQLSKKGTIDEIETNNNTSNSTQNDIILKQKIVESLESRRKEEEIKTDIENIRIIRMNENPMKCAHLFSFGENIQHSDEIQQKNTNEVEGEDKDTDSLDNLDKINTNENENENLTTTNTSSSPPPPPPSPSSVPTSGLTLEKIEEKSRRFCIDIGSPMAVFANGDSVDLMIASGVGRYLEFLSMDSLNVFEVASSKDVHGRNWRVPCSKRDIFSSKELSVMEKNRLMKLLRFVMDWGSKNISGMEDLSTQDDVELRAGRSLNRPQNKTSSDVDAVNIDLEAPFIDYLDSWKISQKLRDAIMYAIALLPDHHSNHTDTTKKVIHKVTNTFDGLAATYRHLSALNHYGSTALLSPLYGGGEISQAFCRLCAVHRGTYVLRHSLHGLVVESSPSDGVVGGGGVEKVIGICDSNGHFISTNRFICQADYLLPQTNEDDAKTKEQEKKGDKDFVSSMVNNNWNVRSDIDDPWTVRRICILDGCIADGKSLSVIKPMTFGIDNKAPIFIIQCDDSTESCPHGLGAVIVHLTTTAAPGFSAQESAHVLAKAISSLASVTNVTEVWHMSFALPLLQTHPCPINTHVDDAGISQTKESRETEAKDKEGGGVEKGVEKGVDKGVEKGVGEGAINPKQGISGMVPLPRLSYSVDPHPIAAQAKQAFQYLFNHHHHSTNKDTTDTTDTVEADTEVPYFKQTDEEREEAARARGEGDEEANALDDALKDDEYRASQREEALKLKALIERVEVLEDLDLKTEKRLTKIENVLRERS